MNRRVLWCAVPLLLAACTSSTAGRGSDAVSSPAPSTPVSTSATAASSSTRPHPSSSAPSTPRSSSASASSPASSTAQRVLAGLSLRQRVGQLFMVDCSTQSVSDSTVAAVQNDDVGSVILDGTSNAGLAATRDVTSRLQQLAPRGLGLFVSTDQEGGLVQRLRGPGFTSIVSGTQQGTIPPATLQGYAQGWGSELRQAGVNVNLAPVLDTVPAGFGSNPPIGDLDRQFGSTPATVTSHGLAVLRGETAAGIDVTVKHFPGLGRVHGNTDLTSGVTDTVTTRNDPYLAPFRAAIQAGAPFVMVSTAIYPRIDPDHPATFSKTIVTGMLRDDLGFRGVIITDDIGNARQVSGYSLGDRAVQFIAAGGDMVLTVDATQAPAMTAAVLARAQRDPAFRAQVDAAALRVLQAKAARGLLG